MHFPTVDIRCVDITFTHIMQIPGNFTPFPQLTIIGPMSLSLSKDRGVNISGASGVIGGAMFNVSALSGNGTGFEFR
jgi:hypothetical protein